MTDATDPLRDFLNRLLASGDTFTAEYAILVEEQVRSAWAGEEPYIASNPDRKDQRARALADLGRGKPVGRVAESTGISRATLYRLLRDGKKG